MNIIEARKKLIKLYAEQKVRDWGPLLPKGTQLTVSFKDNGELSVRFLIFDKDDNVYVYLSFSEGLLEGARSISSLLPAIGIELNHQIAEWFAEKGK